MKFLRRARNLIGWGSTLLLMMPCFGAVTTTSHHQEIKIPLGLMWGDSVQKLEGMARPGGFTITHREELGSKTIVTVHGMLGVALQENLFIFQKEGLVEIEYRYGDPSWNGERYEDFFNSFRRMYDTKYGTGTQLMHSDSKKINQLTVTLTGYQWSQSSSLLQLFYYTAEQGSEHTYRLISLHYKMP